MSEKKMTDEEFKEELEKLKGFTESYLGSRPLLILTEVDGVSHRTNVLPNLISRYDSLVSGGQGGAVKTAEELQDRAVSLAEGLLVNGFLNESHIKTDFIRVVEYLRPHLASAVDVKKPDWLDYYPVPFRVGQEGIGESMEVIFDGKGDVVATATDAHRAVIIMDLLNFAACPQAPQCVDVEGAAKEIHLQSWYDDDRGGKEYALTPEEAAPIIRKHLVTIKRILYDR